MKKLMLFLAILCIPAVCFASSIVEAPVLGFGMQINQSTMSMSGYTSSLSYPSFYGVVQFPIIKDKCEWRFDLMKANYEYLGVSTDQMSIGTGVKIVLN